MSLKKDRNKGDRNEPLVLGASSFLLLPGPCGAKQYREITPSNAEWPSMAAFQETAHCEAVFETIAVETPKRPAQALAAGRFVGRC